MGYDADFIEQSCNEIDEFTCKICMMMIEAPVEMTCCSKLMCYSCLEKCRFNSHADTCPFCRKQTTPGIPISRKNKPLENVLSMLEVRCKDQYCRETMLYEKFQFHHHNHKCQRPECLERLTGYEKLIEEHSDLTDRFNKISTELKDIKEKFEAQKVRNGQLSMERQTLTKKIDNQRKSNKVTLDSYEALRKLHASLEIKNNLMKKKVDSCEKLKAMIKESNILSE
jgi:hypothetical protein